MKDIPIWVRWNRQELVRMVSEEEPGWFTYSIRKKRPLGARWALYRLTLRLPGYLRSVLVSLRARLAPGESRPTQSR